MKVIRDSESIVHEISGATAVTIGVFDGVHLGHRKVLAALERVKEEEKLEQSVLVTFDRHPLSVTHPEMAPPLLTTLEEKISLIEGTGVDYVLVEKFSRDYAKTGYREFIENRLVVGLAMAHLVIGYDLRLGRNREGTPEMMKRESASGSFGLTVVPPERIEGHVVSSSKIRNYLLERQLERAAVFLSRDYFFDASVVKGDSIGKRLHFPTANLEVRLKEKLVPPRGVYAVIAEIRGKRYEGMMNVGSSPTVRQKGVPRRIEVHLFGFSGNIYGEEIRVHCRSFVREEKAFEGIEDLRSQLEKDREAVRRILAPK